jgi:glycosyltransferase involved in cell wall biosynthesis
MRILVFSTLFPNAVRPGHAIFVETRLRELVATGRLEAKVIAPVPWFPFRHPRFGEYAMHARVPRAETRYGLEVLHPRYLSLPKIGMTLAPYLLYRALRPVLQGVLERYPFDVIDAHYFYPDGVAAVMLGRSLRKPVTVTARGTDINLIAEYALPRRMIRWAACHAAGVITVSQALKDRLQALGVREDGIRVLRNGVDLNRFSPAEREMTRNRLGMKRKMLLSVGNLLLFKGHHLAIQALASLPDCDLVIIGSGPDRPMLEAMARERRLAERLRFTGSIGQDELREYYRAADALILASSREGWPNVLLEAMACGTPVVAYAVGGTPEIITTPDAGLLIQERSSEALVKGIRHLFSHYPDRRATRRHAERFSWAATTRGQLELFEHVMAARGRASAGVRPAGAGETTF